MVFILGAGNDQSTNNVIEWLIRLNKDYLRINAEDRIVIRRIETVCHHSEWDIFFSVSDNPRVYNLSEFSSFWYRKGFLRIADYFDRTSLNSEIKYRVAGFIDNEAKAISDLFINMLEKKRNLGNFYLSEPNKLLVLSAAKWANLDIPATLVTSSKEELLNFKAAHKEIICKSVQDIFTGKDEDINYYTRTEVVTDEQIAQFDNTFSPSLFQEKLEKQFEIRSFFFAEKFHSVAIFSQSNDKTKTDFRNYDWSKPNRTVPYILPVNIREQLRILMTHLGLNTGSIDIAFTTKRKYVFLEVNPVGQFGMVSNSCNYDLEKEIARYLTVSNYGE